MFAKVFLLALVASTALVQTQAATRNLFPESEPRLGGIIDEAVKYLQNLIEKIQTSVGEAVENLDLIIKDLTIYAGEIVEQEKFKVEEESRKFIEQLDQIKNEAIEAGVDISECLEGREKDLLDLPVTCGKKIVQCGKDKVDEAKKIVDDAIKAVKDTLADTDEDKKELDNCGSGLEALACATKVMAKMALQMTNIPVKITTQVAKATKLVATIHSSMAKCAAENTIQVAVEGQKIVEEIVACANDKIHPPSPTPIF